MELVNMSKEVWLTVVEVILERPVHATIVASALVLWYYLFWKPFDWYRDYTDLGYDDVKKAYRNYSGNTKRNVINELRRRRRLGDLPPAYPNGWFAVMESDDLKAKEAREANILGLNLVVWRGETGTVYIADAYCPHLGAHLGVGGKVEKDCIKCPFHGWQFNGADGRLAAVPYAASCKPDMAKLRMWTSLERNGFIFIWHHAESEEPSWEPDLVPEIGRGTYSYRGRSEFRISCHVQEIPENGGDINHLNIVHTPALMAGENPEAAPFTWSVFKHIWTGQWKACDETGKRHLAKLDVSTYVEVFNLFRIMKINVQVKQIGPGIVHLEFETAWGKGVMIQTVTPIEPLLQKVTHRMYTARTFIHPYAKLFLLGEAIMISRDISIWNRKMYTRSPILPKEDAAIKRFRLWFSQFYSRNSPRSYLQSSDSNDNSLHF